jgi:hypothetical protein
MTSILHHLHHLHHLHGHSYRDLVLHLVTAAGGVVLIHFATEAWA